MTMHIKRPRIWADASYPGIIRIHLEGTDGGTPPLPVHFEGALHVTEDSRYAGDSGVAGILAEQLTEAIREATHLAETACTTAIDDHDAARGDGWDDDYGPSAA